MAGMSVAVSDPTVSIKQPEEKVHKGRPVGAVARHSKSAVVRLAQLGFDPLEELVKLYHNVSKEIEEMQVLKTTPFICKNGDTRRYSSMAHAQLLATQQKLSNDLMRYGYARVPETVNVKQDVPLGMTINLTPKGGVFSAEDVVDLKVERNDDEEE